MPHDVRSPHIFQDGPGNTASGDQVMDNLDALWAAIDLLVAPGTIRLSGAASPESGWLLCDGAAVSRTTYAALFAKLGTAFGVGDGSTTFNLPDFRGRVPVGVDGSAGRLSANDARGNSAGAETVALSDSHTSRTTFTSAGTDAVAGTTAGGSTIAAVAHNNLQPYQVVNVFVKT